MVQEVRRGALLHDDAIGHEEDPVADLPGKAHLVGDDDGGHARLDQGPDDREHLPHHLRVQGGGGLVEEHHVRLHSQGPHDGQPLLLAAGELAGVLVLLVQQPDPIQEAQGLLVGLGLGLLLQQHRRQGHVLLHGHVGEHVEVLEHHAHLLPVPVHVGALPIDLLALEDHVPAVGLLQKVQTPEEGALAAAGGADDGDGLPLMDLQVHALEHLKAAEALGQFSGFDQNGVSHFASASFHRRPPAY